MNIDLTNINRIVDDFMYAYLSAISDSDHSASGRLALTQKKIIEFDGRYFSISLQLEDYWKYLEYGTKPHFPPIDKIKEWIRIKPVLPRPLQNGKLPTENQLAFLICRKISKAGTKPTHLLADTVRDFQLESKIYKELEKQFQNAQKEALNEN